MEQQPHLNDHNKQEYPPMHTYDSNTSLTKYLYNNELYKIIKNTKLTFSQNDSSLRIHL